MLVTQQTMVKVLKRHGFVRFTVTNTQIPLNLCMEPRVLWDIPSEEQEEDL